MKFKLRDIVVVKDTYSDHYNEIGIVTHIDPWWYTINFGNYNVSLFKEVNLELISDVIMELRESVK